MENKIKLRTANADDAQALLDIYGYYVKETAITYECEVPSVEEFRKRIIHILKEYPYIVAECDGKILGYAYASRFMERAAYAWNVEMTVYIDKDRRGMCIGKKLYSLLEEILKEQGAVKAVAIITPPEGTENDSVYNSKHFHEKLGYKLAGEMKYCGYKFNRWYNTIAMDKILNNPSLDMKKMKKFDEVRERFGL